VICNKGRVIWSVPNAEKRDDDRNHENIEEKTYKGGCKDGEEIGILRRHFGKILTNMTRKWQNAFRKWTDNRDLEKYRENIFM
jgi:hypothetical protein